MKKKFLIILFALMIIFPILNFNTVQFAETDYKVCYQEYGDTDYIVKTLFNENTTVDITSKKRVKLSNEKVANTPYNPHYIELKYLPNAKFTINITHAGITTSSSTCTHGIVGANSDGSDVGRTLEDFYDNASAGNICPTYEEDLEIRFEKKWDEDPYHYVRFRVTIKESARGTMEIKTADTNGNEVTIVKLILDELNFFLKRVANYEKSNWGYTGGDLTSKGEDTLIRVVANGVEIVGNGGAYQGYSLQYKEHIYNVAYNYYQNSLSSDIKGDAETDTRIRTALDLLKQSIDSEIAGTTSETQTEIAQGMEQVTNGVVNSYYTFRSSYTMDDEGEDRFGDFTMDVLSNTESYKPVSIDTSSANKVEQTTGTLLKIITNIGIVCSVIIIAILGLKYMVGSAEEKAEYKKDLVPYFIGAVLLFSITTIVKILQAFGNNLS